MKKKTKVRVILGGLLTVVLICTAVGYAGQCNITATPVNFGNYDIFSSSPLDATGTLNISCNIPPQKGGVVVSVQVDAGNGSLGQRVMVSGLGEQMFYNLYTNMGMTTIFGSAGDPAMMQIVDRATPWVLTIYGRVPPLQSLSAGTYTDLLTATILW